jgi:hypothetical protein
MRNRLTLIPISLGIAAGLIFTVPSIIPRTTLAAPPPITIDVMQIYRNVSRTALPSFDDEYQRYIGVLDVLRPYPGP